jgi:FKBP-type peptidyl-prolyl cis-trans isomerase FkpA
MKSLIYIILLTIFFTGCAKSENAMCTDATPASEEASIQAFCTTNSISAQKDTSGIYYEIISPGTTPSPDLNDSVDVLYKGTFLNGTILDEAQTTTYRSELNDFIDGWTIGLQKIAKGGQIKMVIPSSLCYGCRGLPGLVGPNNILYFDVKLVDVIQMP